MSRAGAAPPPEHRPGACELCAAKGQPRRKQHPGLRLCGGALEGAASEKGWDMWAEKSGQRGLCVPGSTCFLGVNNTLPLCHTPACRRAGIQSILPVGHQPHVSASVCCALKCGLNKKSKVLMPSAPCSAQCPSPTH